PGQRERARLEGLRVQVETRRSEPSAAIRRAAHAAARLADVVRGTRPARRAVLARIADAANSRRRARRHAAPGTGPARRAAARGAARLLRLSVHNASRTRPERGVVDPNTQR